MYKNVDDYIGKSNINSAMEECLRCDAPHLGVLIGKIGRIDSSRGVYHAILGQLYGLLDGVRVKTTEVTEVKKDVIPGRIRKVKLLCNWMTSEGLAKLWNKMTQGDFTWNGIKIVWDCEPDYYVIINSPPINEFIIPNNRCIIVQMEPNMAEHKDMWGDYANPDEKLFIKVCKHKNEYNNVEWHLSKTYTELKTIPIQKNHDYDGVISTVLSAKYHDPGHIKRIDFVKFLEQKSIPVHVYGDNRWEYKDYKGSLPYHCKDNGIFPYKYHFNVENHSNKNYLTEKIIDAILGESLCFYSGCFNLKEFLPEQAFVYLELSNFEEDIKIIQTAIKEDWWSQRIQYIREAKKKILDNLQFFPRLERILNEHEKSK